MRAVLQLLLALFFLLIGVAAVAQVKPCPALESNVSDTRFRAGQVWSYRTRPEEADSTLTILQIDRGAKIGIIIHIRVDGLKVHNPRGELVPFIEHMPFSRDAMLLSVVRLLRSTPNLLTMEGYDRWHADCGGVYTISVADAVSVAEKTFNAP